MCRARGTPHYNTMQLHPRMWPRPPFPLHPHLDNSKPPPLAAPAPFPNPTPRNPPFAPCPNAQRQLADKLMFSSAVEAGNDLSTAIKTATQRAKEGLLGACDFALVMLAGFAHRRGGRQQQAAADGGPVGLMVGTLGLVSWLDSGGCGGYFEGSGWLRGWWARAIAGWGSAGFGQGGCDYGSMLMLAGFAHRQGGRQQQAAVDGGPVGLLTGALRLVNGSWMVVWQLVSLGSGWRK